ncbi:MAG: sigma-70 family RNA polymerase sigma factor [Alphaproteobacteria bacterium]
MESTIEKLSDEDLMSRLAKGDHQAFCVLVRRHTQRFYGCAYRICLHENDAEDVVQDCFLKLWDRPALWQKGQGAKFTTWFYRVVSNRALDIVRKRQCAERTGGDELDAAASGDVGQEGMLQITQEQKALEAALSELSERQRQALNLCFYDGFSNKEAAEIMGLGVKALESLLMRAKNALREKMIKQGLIEEEKNYGS